MKNFIKNYQTLLGSLLLVVAIGYSHFKIIEEIQSKESRVAEEFSMKLIADIDLLAIKIDTDLGMLIENQRVITDNQGLISSRLAYITERQELMENHPHWISHLYD
jgi:hypothetical protein